MTELADRDITNCQDDPEPLSKEKIDKLMDYLDEGWEYVDQHHIERQHSFPDFDQALGFVQKIGKDAEEQWHHPTIEVTWGSVTVSYRTHDVDGVTEADFIMAARADQIYSG